MGQGRGLCSMNPGIAAAARHYAAMEGLRTRSTVLSLTTSSWIAVASIGCCYAAAADFDGDNNLAAAIATGEIGSGSGREMEVSTAGDNTVGFHDDAIVGVTSASVAMSAVGIPTDASDHLKRALPHHRTRNVDLAVRKSTVHEAAGHNSRPIMRRHPRGSVSLMEGGGNSGLVGDRLPSRVSAPSKAWFAGAEETAAKPDMAFDVTRRGSAAGPTEAEIEKLENEKDDDEKNGEENAAEEAPSSAGADKEVSAVEAHAQEVGRQAAAAAASVAGAVDAAARSVLMPQLRMKRQNRAMCTIILCLGGLALFLLHGGWLQDIVQLKIQEKSKLQEQKPQEQYRQYKQHKQQQQQQQQQHKRSTAVESAGIWVTARRRSSLRSNSSDNGSSVSSPQLRRRLILVGNLIGRIFILHPLVEYILHRAVHMSGTPGRQKDHHDLLWLKEPAPFEFWPYVMAVVTYLLPWTRDATLGLLQYAWFHQLSHDMPWLVRSTAKLHAVHHRDVTTNFCMSLPAPFHWPDMLFGTYRAK